MHAHAPDTALSQGAADDILAAYQSSSGKASELTFTAIAAKSSDIELRLQSVSSLNQLTTPERSYLRRDMFLVSDAINKLDKHHSFASVAEDEMARKYKKNLDSVSRFIPAWVKVTVAIVLGFGTMVGWKRIVVTVGEKIGKQHLTYAQGASAGLVAMSTIGLATYCGLPVSTTHVLSSGIAGTMVANGSGLQSHTLRNIVLAWVLTLPVCVLLGGGIFSAAIYFVFHVLHAH